MTLPACPEAGLNSSKDAPLIPRKAYDVPLAHEGVLRLGPRTLIMGVVNVTPDSFAGDGHADPVPAIAKGLALVDAGADILDVGGESTRPGATPLNAETERRRVEPVIEALVNQTNVPVSVDTYKAVVARTALNCGASLVNDVSGLRYDPDLAGEIVARRAGLILAHTRGRSSDMYSQASYKAATEEIVSELEWSLEAASDAGITREHVIVDPGLGFAKRAEHSMAVLSQLDRLRSLDRPILVGPSRKSFLTAVLGNVPPAERDWGTAGAIAASILLGAHVVRVHSVRAMVDVVRVTDAIRMHREGVSVTATDQA